MKTRFFSFLPIRFSSVILMSSSLSFSLSLPHGRENISGGEVQVQPFAILSVYLVSAESDHICCLCRFFPFPFLNTFILLFIFMVALYFNDPEAQPGPVSPCYFPLLGQMLGPLEHHWLQIFSFCSLHEDVIVPFVPHILLATCAISLPLGTCTSNPKRGPNLEKATWDSGTKSDKRDSCKALF